MFWLKLQIFFQTEYFILILKQIKKKKQKYSIIIATAKKGLAPSIATSSIYNELIDSTKIYQMHGWALKVNIKIV